MNKPKKIIIHCSATPDGGDKFGAADIDSWHKSRGWDGIGYHWVVRRSGLVEPGRFEHVVPASVRGHNKGTLAICMIGTKRFEVEQYNALVALITTKLDSYGLDIDDIYGHYELANKECPGIDMTLLRMFLKERY